MSTIHQFSDGSKIEQDPRLEDPLLYYTPYKGQSIGFDIAPGYEQWTAESVVLSVYSGHLGRLQALSEQEVYNMMEGVLWCILARYKNWKTIAFEWPDWVFHTIGAPTLEAWMGRAGWETSTAGHQYWQRT